MRPIALWWVHLIILLFPLPVVWEDFLVEAACMMSCLDFLILSGLQALRIVSQVVFTCSDYADLAWSDQALQSAWQGQALLMWKVKCSMTFFFLHWLLWGEAGKISVSWFVLISCLEDAEKRSARPSKQNGCENKAIIYLSQEMPIPIFVF